SNMIKIGFSIGYLQEKYGDFRALEIAKEIGADAVDFSTCGTLWDYRNPASVYSKSFDEIKAYYRKVKEKADRLGLIISQTHGQITGFRNIKEEDDALIRNAEIDCLAASVLGAPYVVIHSVTSIYMGPDADPGLMHDLNFDMFNRIIPFAKKYGVKIATETFGDAVRFKACDFFGNIDEFLKSYERICSAGDNKDYLVFCADTGHSNKASRFNRNPSSANVIRALGSQVKVLHLNDNDTLTDQHKMPLSGTIDWKDVFDALDEIGYSGVYNMELALSFYGDNMAIDTAAFAIKVLRNYLLKREEAK
ncbi:MAG: sugar phosphate isomerase/epimerase, partial [Clostridia bacterium]|nr:sugar phosphate isomerase/epimerase [Clostridia bacterium]